MKYFIGIFFFIFTLYAEPATVKDRLLQGKKGDFIISEKDHLYTALIIHEIQNDYIILEQVCTVQKPDSWKQWLESARKGATSWNMFYIDLYHNELIDIYSPLQKKHYIPETSSHFIMTLCNLPLKQTPENQQKKIGPPPPSGELDRRPLWKPSKFVDGKKEPFSSLDIRTIRWPDDHSEFSGKLCDLYFDHDFAFPFWGQIRTGHLQIIMHSIDSGKNLSNNISFPDLPPSLLDQTLEEDYIFLTLQSYPRQQDILLYIVENSQFPKKITPITYSVEKKGTKIYAKIPIEPIKQILTQNSPYQWIISSRQAPHKTLEVPGKIFK
ncbi:MAG: hypothetical protein JW769_02045 [Parachlamydiales bacterium]|nr:hypothetical protein [Parachlamydiales bacterium]